MLDLVASRLKNRVACPVFGCNTANSLQILVLSFVACLCYWNLTPGKQALTA